MNKSLFHIVVVAALGGLLFGGLTGTDPSGGGVVVGFGAAVL